MSIQPLDRIFEREHILNSLRALGYTPDEIAVSLQKLGVKGHRVKSQSCPIFNYLALEGHRIISVGGLIVSSSSTVQIPTPVNDFIRYFDKGMYPYLDEDAKQSKFHRWFRRH